MSPSPGKLRLRNVAFKTLPEIQRRLRTEADRQAERLGLGGAELRGSNYLLNRLVREFLDVEPRERDRRIDRGLVLERAELADCHGPSVPPGDGGLIRRPTIGIEGGRVEYVDTKGEHPAPQKRHAPKRRS